jgi:hypothetical protein
VRELSDFISYKNYWFHVCNETGEGLPFDMSLVSLAICLFKPWVL